MMPRVMQCMMPLAALCFLWAGMVLGISFLETPVKFTAPTVTLAIGLDVGRHVFGAFNKVETGLALLAVALLFRARPTRTLWLPLGMVLSIVLLQSAWLLPLLDARVSLIIKGQTPPPAPYHWVYIVLEVLKAIGLITAGFVCLRNLRKENFS